MQEDELLEEEEQEEASCRALINTLHGAPISNAGFPALPPLDEALPAQIVGIVDLSICVSDCRFDFIYRRLYSTLSGRLSGKSGT